MSIAAFKSAHLVDPELWPALQFFPDLNIDKDRIAQLRAESSAAMPPLETYAGQGVRLSRIEIPADERGPSVGCILHRPEQLAGLLPLFLHIHGGGYVFGEALGNVHGNIRTALEVGCMVASVDYRLSPEAQGTSAVEDCYRALRWLVSNAAELGIDAARIAIGGESAGGGLAAALALLTRDRGEFALRLQMLIYPMLDDATGQAPLTNPLCGEYVWTPAANRVGWDCLIGEHEPQADGYIVPSRASNLAGLPPTYLSVGALDLFLDEDIDFARRLMQSGVPVELHVYPGAFHGFELAAEAQVSRRAEQERRDALWRAFSV